MITKEMIRALKWIAKMNVYKGKTLSGDDLPKYIRDEIDNLVYKKFVTFNKNPYDKVFKNITLSAKGYYVILMEQIKDTEIDMRQLIGDKTS